MTLTLKFLEQVTTNLYLLINDKSKCLSFLEKFPFHKLLNVNAMDNWTLRHCLIILDFVISLEDFYSDLSSVDYCFDFMLLILTLTTENVDNTVEKLLELVSRIIEGIHSFGGELSQEKLINEERLVEIILKLTKLDLFDRNIAKYCCNIFYKLNKISLKFPVNIPGISVTFSLIFEQFKRVQAVKEMCIIVEIILEKFNVGNADFEQLFNWITHEAHLFLIDAKPDIEAILIITCLLSYDTKLKLNNKLQRKIQNNFYKNLMKVSHKICEFSCCQLDELKTKSLKLLTLITKQFYENEYNSFNYQFNFDNELNKLTATNLNEWSTKSRDLFLIICHMLGKHCRDKLFWSCSEIMSVIIETIYSRKLLLFHLKTIAFLYSITIQECFRIETVVVGDDILHNLMTFRHLSEIYSFNREQLTWILKRGMKPLKIAAVKEWLLYSDDEFDERNLIRTLQCYNEQEILVDLLKYDFRRECGVKVVSIIRKISDSNLSKKITLALPWVVKQTEIFNCLILCKPGIPSDPEHSILICTILAAMIPKINDTKVLLKVCTFLIKLLISLNNGESVRGVCRNLNNLSYLIEENVRVDDEVSIGIVRLFGVLVELQERHNVELQPTITINNITSHLKGNEARMSETLKLVNYLLINNNKLFLQINEQFIFDFYQKLLDLSENLELTSISYNCIIGLFNKYNWLVISLYTSQFVEMTCLTSKNTNFDFLNLLKVWLRLIKYEPNNGFCSVPIKAVVSFILRVPGIDMNTVDYYFKILKQLEMKKYF